MQFETKENKKKELKEELCGVLLASTMHGVPNMTKAPNNFIRFLWLICMMFSISSCGYFLYYGLINYLDYNKVTLISVIYEQPLAFPTISICNRDTYNLSINDIIYCQINFDFECSEKKELYFEKFTDPYYKDCLRFNSGKNFFGKPNNLSMLKAFFGGKENGLTLDFKVNALKDYSCLYVHIHNSTNPPYSLYNKGLELSPGRVHYIAVDRIITEKLSEPYNDCLDDVNKFQKNKTLIDYILNSSKEYTQKDCFDLCFNMNYIKNNPCNCSNYSLHNVLEKCFANKALYSLESNCTIRFRKEFIQKSVKECRNYCPLECKTSSYYLNTFTLDFPSNGNLTLKDKTNMFESKFDTFEETQRNFFSLVVYYEELKYTLITENPSMTIVDLVSNVGGILGVFTGISFLSFIEIFELIFDCLIFYRFQK